YHEILFMIDTCQANTMYGQIYSPNILATGSSELGENSYSHHMDSDIGVAVIDRYTYYNLEFLEKIDMQSKSTLQDLFNSYDPMLIHSTPGVRSDLFRRPLDKVLVTDFFGSVQNVELTGQKYNLSNSDTIPSSTFNETRIGENGENKKPTSRNFHLVNVNSRSTTSPLPQFLIVSTLFGLLIRWQNLMVNLTTPAAYAL
ncbi:10535_t:CDS:2, partial [Acaulospora morrowiae]